MSKTAIRVQLAALADMVITSEDKKLSVIGIFDKMFVKTLPSVHPKMVFVVTLAGEPSKAQQLHLRIIPPSGKDEFAADVSFVFGENGKANLLSNFDMFPIKEAGTYEFRLEKQGTCIVSYPLEIILVHEDTARKVAN